MATLEIRKKATKTWEHIPSDHKQYMVSKIYCKFNGDMFRVIEWGGRQRAEYHFSDITVYDDTQGGTPENFGSAVALMLRLEALEYIGFPLGSGSGGVGFQPTIVNPLNGQTLIYNSTTGIWHNGYIDVEGNRFLQIVEIPPAVGNVLTIPIGFIWVILNDTYSLLDNWVEEIPYTSEEGMIRKDIIVAIAGNNMIRIEGQESDTNPLEPTLPPNTLLVTQIDVFHDSIGEPTEPIVGNNYVTKTSQGWVGYQLNISSPQVAPTLGTNHSIAFRAFANGHSIIGLNITSTNTPDKMWSGVTFGIRNDSDFPITLKHLYISSSKIRFSFPSGQDLILTKEMGVKYFKLGTIPTTGPAYAYCLNDFVSGSGDFIPLSGTEVGKPLTDEIEVDTSDGNVGFYSDNFGLGRVITMTDDGLNVIQNTDTNTNENSQINNTPQNTTITTTDADGNKAEIVVGDYGTVTFNSNIPDDNFDGELYYNAEEGIVVKDNNNGNYSNLHTEGVNGNTANNLWSLRKSDTDVNHSRLLFPDTGLTPRRIPVSVNGNYTNQQGDIELELTADNIDYDNTASGLLAETVQEAVDEVYDKKLDKVTTGSTERVYSVNEANNQAMIPTMEQFVSDTAIISALEAITTDIATISVPGKTMYKGQLYVSDSPAYIYLAYDDNQIIRK